MSLIFSEGVRAAITRPITLKTVIPWVIAVAMICYILVFFYKYYSIERLRRNSLEWVERRQKPVFALKRAGRLARVDILPMALVTFAYAVTTFVRLGDTAAPQSFHEFESGKASVTIELAEPAAVERVFYYTGLYHGGRYGGYRLEFSPDGRVWTEQYGTKTERNKETGDNETIRLSGMTQEYSQLFRWLNASLLPEKPADTKYIRITAQYSPLELGEISITVRGEPLSYGNQTGVTAYAQKTLSADELIIPETAAALFDEQDIVPARYDVMNSTHFDEIYHARAAYEHLRNVYPNERTHPPLGKLITALGISMFGMTPFGWRFMPALFGVFMLPLIYILLKWLFGKTPVALCGTLLFAFDFMHFTQTRISTIDVYAVFFILLMYLFMYRYITSGYDTPFWKSTPPLILTGLSFGLGAAAKWVCVYAGAGLLLLYTVYLYNRYRHYREMGRSFFPFLLGTLMISLASFIIIPGIAYIACYIPYATARAAYMPGDTKEFFLQIWGEFYKNQSSMFRYHSGLTEGHSYSARWYEWLIDWKPILYYWNSVDAEGTRGSLWAFTNPLVTWAGLGALAACAAGAVKRYSHTAMFILIGYFSQLIPWIPVSRITFPYHYFPSMLFICLGLAYMFHRMIERDPARGTRQMIIFTAAAVALFALFYPVISGLQVPSWYPQYLLQWLPNGHWFL